MNSAYFKKHRFALALKELILGVKTKRGTEHHLRTLSRGIVTLHRGVVRLRCATVNFVQPLSRLIHQGFGVLRWLHNLSDFYRGHKNVRAFHPWQSRLR